MNRAVCILDQNGVVLHSENSETATPLYSITKTMIAVLVVDLVSDLRRAAGDWLDKNWLPRGGEISIFQLLTHTSGLTDYGGLAAYQTAVAAGDDPWNDRQYADQTLCQPLLFEPGEGWAYSNPGFWVLKRVCELESGKEFASLVQEQIASRFNAPSLHVASGLFSDRLPTYQAGWVWHGLVCGNARDTARFMASNLVSRLNKTLVAVPNAGPLYPNAAYGLGVMGDLSGTNYGHNGSGPGFSTSCFHFPGTRRTVSCFLPYDGPEDAAYMQMQTLAKKFGLT
ncbi:MAG: beta-lactamase family protein [Rhodobiaceae bacterium]|nr:beta-lactamase family protein [Rhodobiaceae bacterium]